MLKLSDNPPILPPSVESIADLQGEWYVAHTKARCEKALAWDLLHHGIGYFLPLVERITFSGGRKRRVLKPLFPSYLFFCGDRKDRYVAMTTNRICRAIEVADQPTLTAELAALESVIRGKAPLDLYPRPAVGRRCRVTMGPFEGLEGTMIDGTNSGRLVLAVSFISQGAAMEIDAALLELL